MNWKHCISEHHHDESSGCKRDKDGLGSGVVEVVCCRVCKLKIFGVRSEVLCIGGGVVATTGSQALIHLGGEDGRDGLSGYSVGKLVRGCGG